MPIGNIADTNGEWEKNLVQVQIFDRRPDTLPRKYVSVHKTQIQCSEGDSVLGWTNLSVSASVSGLYKVCPLNEVT